MSPTVAVIPARGGSTRIPRKNIADFNGSPMIAWAIQAALSSGRCDRVVVSTDDTDIADVARDHGAEVPFMRPVDLASDIAGTAPVIRHALEELTLGDDTTVVCLYPTAAIPGSILSKALDTAVEHPQQFLISVGRHRSPLERALVSTSEGALRIQAPAHLLTRTQDLPVRYFDAGKFYVAPASLWRSHETMMASPFQPFFLPEWASVDIDEPEDWPVAEALHRAFVLDAHQ